MATSLADIEADARRENRRHELWSRWRRRILIVVGTGMAIVFVLWTNWMAQRYLILGDDTARGERFRDAIRATATGTPQVRERLVADQCQAAAESFYNHGILGSGDDGPAPPNEKAFLHACSGAILGGHGGGADDGD